MDIQFIDLNKYNIFLLMLLNFIYPEQFLCCDLCSYFKFWGLIIPTV